MTTDYARSDVYPPEVEAITDEGACRFETHALGCPCGMGGEPLIRNRCHWCGRDADFYGYVNVSLADGRVVRCCDVCWERGDEGIDLPLDMTEDTWDG